MFALWPFNSECSLMILVSGSIADLSWTLEAAWLAVRRHHVLLGSRSGQTHSLTYTHIHTPAPLVPLIPEHVTGQTWDLVILQTSQTWAQNCGNHCSDLPWWDLLSLIVFFLNLIIKMPKRTVCVLVVPQWRHGFSMCTECGCDAFGLSLLPFMWLSNSRCRSRHLWLLLDSYILNQRGSRTRWKWILFIDLKLISLHHFWSTGAGKHAITCAIQLGILNPCNKHLSFYSLRRCPRSGVVQTPPVVWPLSQLLS